MTPQDNWTSLCSVKSHLSQPPHNQLEDQSLLSAVQSVGCGEWLEVAHQTLQRREEEVQGQKGDVWRQCSNLLLLWEVYLEKHPKQLPKLPINQSKADLLQQEIPTSYLLLSCHTAAVLRPPCPSAQATAVSVQQSETSPKPIQFSCTSPPDCGFTRVSPVCPLHSDLNSQEITWASPSCPASLKLSKSAQIFGKGRGKSKCLWKWSLATNSFSAASQL